MRLLYSKPACRVLLFAAMLLIVLGSDRGSHTNPDIPNISKRINAFTFELLKHQAKAKDVPENIVLSPQCIFHGFAMNYIASGGETRKELGEIFHFPTDNKDLLKAVKGLRQELQMTGKHKGIEVNMANSAWLDETYADFQKEFVKEVENAFDAPLYRVTFAQKEQVSNDINKWISEMTHGRIKKSVDASDFNSRSRPGIIDEPALIMVNAVYFKADWGSQFGKEATRKRTFHIDSSTATETVMMHQRSVLLYSEDEHFKFLELPYIGGLYSMYALLPKKIADGATMMDEVGMETVVGLKRQAISHEVDVLFPKFEMKSHLGVKSALSEMGLKSPFDKQRADFDKMIIKKFDTFRVYITDSYHDAWIKVHEEGTEAAAATATAHFSFGCSAPRQPMPAEFHADHPFLFMIVHNESRSILFAGWISNPEKLAQQGAEGDAVRPTL